MTRHTLSLITAAAAVALLAGCATPSTPTPSAAAAPAAAPAPAPAAPVAATPSTPGTAGGVGAGSSRSTALAPAPAPAPAPVPAAVAQPENASVFFDFDDARMKAADLAVIERYGRYLNAVAGASARVEGHADERGSSEYNLALGQRRAQSVVDALKVLGVADRRVEAVSYGEERPRARGSNEEAWSQNRRADLSIKR